jgi:hypothetical protein
LLESQPAGARSLSPAEAKSAIDAWAARGYPSDEKAEVFGGFLSWLEVAPEAALDHWDASGCGPLSSGPVTGGMPSVASILRRLPVKTLSLWLANKNWSHWVMGPVRSALALAIGAHGDADELETAIAGLNGAVRLGFLLDTLQAWPADRLSKLEDLLVRYPEPALIGSYVNRLPAAARMAWIGQAMDHPVLGKAVAAAGLAGSTPYAATGAPLADRLAVLAREAETRGGTPPNDDARARLIATDVAAILQSAVATTTGETTAGPLADWEHKLRTGQVTASQLLTAVCDSLPALAKDHRDDITAAVFAKAAAANPADSFTLLASFTAKDREKLVLQTATTLGKQGNSRQMLELLALQPPTPASRANDRFLVWLTASDPGVRSHGDSYGTWVMSLPHGLDRDMALSALAARVESTDPDWAARLRAAKTLPAAKNPANP